MPTPISRDQRTRTVKRELLAERWKPGETIGSHTIWYGANGTVFSLPDGFRTISPGVYQKLLEAMDEERD